MITFAEDIIIQNAFEHRLEGRFKPLMEGLPLAELYLLAWDMADGFIENENTTEQ